MRLARAGASEFEGAVSKQRRAVQLARRRGVDPAEFQARLVSYLERAGRFAQAAAAGTRAPEAIVVPLPGPGLIAQGVGDADELSSEGARQPISVGAAQLRPVTLMVLGPPSVLAFTGGVLDISFIPQFRAVAPVTVGLALGSSDTPATERSCRATRDRLLAGQKPEAHADVPTQCDSSLLRAVEQFEAGDLQGAIAGLDLGFTGQSSLTYSMDGNPRQAAILDADQNMWRSAASLEEAAGHRERAADDFEKAARAAALLTKFEVADPKGPDQAGEIAYLQKDYKTAARLFEAASKRAVGETVATELLKIGTALEMAGDQASAGAVLQDALARLPTMSCDPAAPATLAPGASITCTGKRTVTQAEVDAGIIGTAARITGLDPANNPAFSCACAVGTDNLVASLSLTKTTVPSSGVVAGTVVTTTVTAQNTGTVILHGVGASGLSDQGLLDSYNAQLQAGDTALNHKVLHEEDTASRDSTLREAEAHYQAARQTEALLRGRSVAGFITSRREELFRPEVLENNEALVLIELGQKPAALEAIEAAVDFDPMNPIFLANEGYVHEQLGHDAAAEKAYRTALASDPTSFQAANNLGVILGNDGHLSEASRLFRQALAAHRDYPTAAFNLGLVLGRMGPSHVLESQGELAVAIRQDPELRERDHELIPDEDIVFTTLDLSKPLPPDWHFSTSEQRTPITVATIVFALLLFRLVKAVAQERVSATVTESGLRASTRRLSAARTISAGGYRPPSRSWPSSRCSRTPWPARREPRAAISCWSASASRSRRSRSCGFAPRSPVATRCVYVTTRASPQSSSAARPLWSGSASRPCPRPGATTRSHGTPAGGVRASSVPSP